MLTEIVRFAALGIGAGAVYSLLGLGLVLIYRGSGVINFAHGAIGMAGAYLFYELRSDGVATVYCWVISVGVGLLVGAAIQLLLMRPLRKAPALTRVIATLGLLSIFLAYGVARYGDAPRLVSKIIPADRVVLWGDIIVGRDRIIIALIACGIALALALIYRFTTFGRSTVAVAENRRSTAALGISPDAIAAANWALGSGLAVVGTILIVNISGLNVAGLTLLVVPALAAALMGGLRSFFLTLFGGLLIGVLQSEVGWLTLYLTERWDRTVNLDGWADSVPFLLIIAILFVRGRPLPLRDDVQERPPALGDGVVRLSRLLPGAGVVAICAGFLLSDQLTGALTTSAAIGCVVLSLVVVTGYTGQLSMAQLSLAGMGAWICAALIASHGWSFETAAIAGVLGTVPVGILVGLPSLRTRGVHLAIATMGLAIVIDSLFLGNSKRNGGMNGWQIGSPSVFGLDLDPGRHPHRYAVACCVLFTLLAVLVANLRRSKSGRRLIAVRVNERAAAALGIHVMSAKVYAFAFGAAIAGVGGILMLMRQPIAVFLPAFSSLESIFIVIYAVLGGIGFVSGSMIAGLLASGGLAVTVMGNWTDFLNNGWGVQLLTGVMLLVNLITQPDGIAHMGSKFRSRVASQGGARKPSLSDHVDERVTPKTLSLKNVSVRFGGKQALDDISMDIAPGEVLGLIGPNGAGKTTLIDAISGFVPSHGEVFLGGTRISRWSPDRRARAGANRSFQSLELFDTMTVYENLRTAADARSKRSAVLDLLWPSRPHLDGFGAAAVREFELEPFLGRRPDELPYGARRLVAIARAVASGPSVLLLDEPAAGLDDQERAELSGLIRRLADRWGIAVVLVEHDLQLVFDVCDRIAVLDQGRQIAAGDPSEVRDNPEVITAYLGSRGTDDQARAPGTVVMSGRPQLPHPGASHGPLLRVTDLHAGYGDLAAVRDLNLQVAEGEIVALLGPNGAGKTTTLLTLAGELNPIRGNVEIFGNHARLPLHRLAREGLSFVAAERSLTNALTTRANLRLGRGSVSRALELFPEIEGLLHRRAGLLSGGEQQMVALARALAAEPKALLVDELSLGLAPMITERLLAMVRSAADNGVAIVLVEQHTADALAIADRVVVLRNGQVALSCSAEEIGTDPSRLEAAYLSGSVAELEPSVMTNAD